MYDTLLFIGKKLIELIVNIAADSIRLWPIYL